MDDDAPLLPDRVRAAAAAVAARARSVQVDDGALVAYAATIPLDQVARPTLAPDDLPVPADDVDGILAWVLAVHAVNFGSGFFPVLAKRPGLSGSRTVFACLRERFRRDGPLTVDDLRRADPAGCAALFGQDPVGPAAELMAWFAQAWRGLGEAVAERWDGRYAALLDDAGGSAARLAGLLAEVPGWRDEPVHDGRPVPLYKRAQIVPAHLAMAFGGRGPGAFGDLDRLTIFADNLVPHVLRIDGVLRFDPDLVARIDREDLLDAGSPEEVEIRAVAVHAAERLVEVLREGVQAATEMGLDQVLWSRGAQPRYKAHPRHRARTTAY